MKNICDKYGKLKFFIDTNKVEIFRKVTKEVELELGFVGEGEKEYNFWGMEIKKDFIVPNIGEPAFCLYKVSTEEEFISFTKSTVMDFIEKRNNILTDKDTIEAITNNYYNSIIRRFSWFLRSNELRTLKEYKDLINEEECFIVFDGLTLIEKFNNLNNIRKGGKMTWVERKELYKLMRLLKKIEKLPFKPNLTIKHNVRKYLL